MRLGEQPRPGKLAPARGAALAGATGLEMATTYLSGIRLRRAAQQELQQQPADRPHARPRPHGVLLPPLTNGRTTQCREREHARHLADLECRMDARGVSMRKQVAEQVAERARTDWCQREAAPSRRPRIAVAVAVPAAVAATAATAFATTTLTAAAPTAPREISHQYAPIFIANDHHDEVIDISDAESVPDGDSDAWEPSAAEHESEPLTVRIIVTDRSPDFAAATAGDAGRVRTRRDHTATRSSHDRLSDKLDRVRRDNPDCQGRLPPRGHFLSFVMATHPRLGESSPCHGLNGDVLRRIEAAIWGEPLTVRIIVTDRSPAFAAATAARRPGPEARLVVMCDHHDEEHDVLEMEPAADSSRVPAGFGSDAPVDGVEAGLL